MELRTLFILSCSLCCLLGAQGQLESAGLEFAVAFPYDQYEEDAQPNELQITAGSVGASFTITGAGGFLVQDSVDANSTYRLVVGTEWDVTNDGGLDSKVLFVESSDPVSVSYCRVALFDRMTPDGALVHPKPPHSEVSYTFPLSGAAGQYSPARSTGGYYIVAAYEDDTRVDVWLMSDTGEWVHDASVNLNRYQMFSQRRHLTDAHGYLKSDKPVSVFSGGTGVFMPHGVGQCCVNQHVMDSVAPMDHYARNYVAFPIPFGHPNPGYKLRVIPLENDTFIRIPELDILTQLDALEIYEMDGQIIHPADEALTVICSNPCKVTQYAREIRERQQDEEQSGMFMVDLTPSERLMDNVTFSSPALLDDATFTGLLAIIYYSDVVGDIYLNGENLSFDENWQVTGDEQYSYLTRELEARTTYHLYSDDDKFAAYFYASQGFFRATGYNLGYGNYTYIPDPVSF